MSFPRDLSGGDNVKAGYWFLHSTGSRTEGTHRTWVFEPAKFQGEEAFPRCKINPFLEGEAALAIDFCLPPQLDVLWPKQVANTG